LHLTGKPVIIARRHELSAAPRPMARYGSASYSRPTPTNPALNVPQYRLGDFANSLPESAADGADIRYEEFGPVGYLHFDLYNGALSTAQCDRLRSAYALACGGRRELSY
jgi:hypothetical protein